MLFTTTLIITALAMAPAWAIPPPIFGFPDSDNHTELGVSFTFNGNQTTVQEGMLLGGNITQIQPLLTLNPSLYASVAAYTGRYIILMVDPDASTPQDPSRRFILHWLAANVTQRAITDNTAQRGLIELTTASDNDNVVPYNPPMPGVTSDAHRYILYAFAQPQESGLPAGAVGNFSSTNRAGFNVTGFMEAAGLERPMAAEYWYVSRRAEVPGDFVALAGGVYPGGNGGAVFDSSVSGGGSGNETGTAGGGGTTGTTSTGAEGKVQWVVGTVLGVLVGFWALL